MQIHRFTRRQALRSLSLGIPALTLAQSTLTRSQGSQVRAQRDRSVRYTLSWLPSSIDAPLITAVTEGYFADQGLDVTYERGFGSADSITKIAAGQYEIGEGDPYSMIEFNAKNPDLALVAIYVHYNKSPFGIYSLKENGITEPQQLEGKRLGAPPGDAPRRLWPVFAKTIGIDPDAVTWVNMEPKLRETFLLQGQVDAISGFMTSALPNIVRGGVPLDEVQTFFYTDYGLDLYGNALITRAEFAEENPELIQDFLRAYVRAWQEVIQAPDAGVDRVLAVGRESGEILNEETERLRMSLAMENLMVTPEVRENGLGMVDSERLAQSIDQVVEGFELETSPSVEQVFNGEFLPDRAERLIA